LGWQVQTFRDERTTPKDRRDRREPASVSQGAEQILELLDRAVPYEAAPISVWDPER
jgi:hypothetical protein